MTKFDFRQPPKPSHRVFGGKTRIWSVLFAVNFGGQNHGKNENHVCVRLLNSPKTQQKVTKQVLCLPLFLGWVAFSRMSVPKETKWSSKKFDSTMFSNLFTYLCLLYVGCSIVILSEFNMIFWKSAASKSTVPNKDDPKCSHQFKSKKKSSRLQRVWN